MPFSPVVKHRASARRFAATRRQLVYEDESSESSGDEEQMPQDQERNVQQQPAANVQDENAADPLPAAISPLLHQQTTGSVSGHESVDSLQRPPEMARLNSNPPTPILGNTSTDSRGRYASPGSLSSLEDYIKSPPDRANVSTKSTASRRSFLPGIDEDELEGVLDVTQAIDDVDGDEGREEEGMDVTQIGWMLDGTMLDLSQGLRDMLHQETMAVAAAIASANARGEDTNRELLPEGRFDNCMQHVDAAGNNVTPQRVIPLDGDMNEDPLRTPVKPYTSSIVGEKTRRRLCWSNSSDDEEDDNHLSNGPRTFGSSPTLINKTRCSNVSGYLCDNNSFDSLIDYRYEPPVIAPPNAPRRLRQKRIINRECAAFKPIRLMDLFA